ncbi:hypothetical protein E2562_027919 [Oryza meyeriana var. granulata]|uniref:Uncharacterized protein n=1 Tax=Oryza meyeriana var. granulata TaxID=110450 RepID=A0A6G1EZJ3_9ORYZ|nr:hypothetical protein E2562_027919 [Oryza meyeriana var. granulata]
MVWVKGTSPGHPNPSSVWAVTDKMSYLTTSEVGILLPSRDEGVFLPLCHLRVHQLSILGFGVSCSIVFLVSHLGLDT